jgi:hypothetical protein
MHLLGGGLAEESALAEDQVLPLGTSHFAGVLHHTARVSDDQVAKGGHAEVRYANRAGVRNRLVHARVAALGAASLLVDGELEEATSCPFCQVHPRRAVIGSIQTLDHLNFHNHPQRGRKDVVRPEATQLTGGS